MPRKSEARKVGVRKRNRANPYAFREWTLLQQVLARDFDLADPYVQVEVREAVEELTRKDCNQTGEERRSVLTKLADLASVFPKKLATPKENPATRKENPATPKENPATRKENPVTRKENPAMPKRKTDLNKLSRNARRLRLKRDKIKKATAGDAPQQQKGLVADEVCQKLWLKYKKHVKEVLKQNGFEDRILRLDIVSKIAAMLMAGTLKTEEQLSAILDSDIAKILIHADSTRTIGITGVYLIKEVTAVSSPGSDLFTQSLSEEADGAIRTTSWAHHPDVGVLTTSFTNRIHLPLILQQFTFQDSL